ncbi:MAG: Gfo/Idh/MocA family oxidoreductase [Bacteroidales bacterium]
MINWGIIGCGNVTEVKSGPAFNKVKGSRLVAVMRRNSELAEDYARRHNVPKFYNNADDLILDPDVNAVYIATPPGSHAEYSIKALKAGKPVYVEKPMALNHRECQKIIKASQKYKIPVFVAYYRRTLPGFLKVKEFINNGLIGKVRYVQITFVVYPSEEERSGETAVEGKPHHCRRRTFFDLAYTSSIILIFGPDRGP